MNPTLAIFLHRLSATGVVRNALAISCHMRKSGWRVVLITVRPGGELAELADGVEHVVLGGSKLPRKLELMAAVGSLRRAIDALAPDVIMSAGNHGHRAMLAAMKGNNRVATVYRISNDLTHGARPSHPLTMINPRRWMARRIMRDANKVVLVSPHLADDPVLVSGLRSGKVSIIANGVDVAMAKCRASEPCDHPWAFEAVPIVLAVGRLDRQKNLLTLIKAFALARAERELRLMIVGSDKPRARRKLDKMAAKLGVAQDIAFVGQVANPFPYFRVATVLALPSKWEGCPNVLLEALACELPVVASRTAGNADTILQDGRFGILVDPLDASMMGQALLMQIEPQTRILPETRAWEYDRAGTLDQYQAMFDEVVAGVRAAAPRPEPSAHSQGLRYGRLRIVEWLAERKPADPVA